MFANTHAQISKVIYQKFSLVTSIRYSNLRWHKINMCPSLLLNHGNARRRGIDPTDRSPTIIWAEVEQQITCNLWRWPLNVGVLVTQYLARIDSTVMTLVFKSVF